jgi:hypothetical protein
MRLDLVEQIAQFLLAVVHGDRLHGFSPFVERTPEGAGWFRQQSSTLDPVRATYQKFGTSTAALELFARAD